MASRGAKMPGCLRESLFSGLIPQAGCSARTTVDVSRLELAMLDEPFANALKRFSRPVRDVLGWAEPPREHDDLPEMPAHPNWVAMGADDEFPSIVRKAQDDVHWRKALSMLGYSQVRAAYAQHRQEGLDVFQALGGQDRLRPPLDFVRDWLKEERRRIFEQVRWLFVVTMLATILAGMTFVATIALLG